MLRYVRYVTLCYVMLCYVMLVLLCYVMLRYITLRYVTLRCYVMVPVKTQSGPPGWRNWVDQLLRFENVKLLLFLGRQGCIQDIYVKLMSCLFVLSVDCGLDGCS